MNPYTSGVLISNSLQHPRATLPYDITFMMHDKAQNSQSSLQHIANNQSCLKVVAVTTGSLYIFPFVWPPLCIPLHASLKSAFILLCESIASGAHWALLQVMVLKRGSSLEPLGWYKNLHACVHTFMAACWSCLLFYCQYQTVQRLTAVDRGWIVAVQMMAAFAEIEWLYLETS